MQHSSQNPDDWRSVEFRTKVVEHIEIVMARSQQAPSTSAREYEQRLFSQSQTREEYINFIKNFITKIKGTIPQQNVPQNPGMVGAQPGQQQMGQMTNEMQQNPGMMSQDPQQYQNMLQQQQYQQQQQQQQMQAGQFMPMGAGAPQQGFPQRPVGPGLDRLVSMPQRMPGQAGPMGQQPNMAGQYMQGAAMNQQQQAAQMAAAGHQRPQMQGASRPMFPNNMGMGQEMLQQLKRLPPEEQQRFMAQQRQRAEMASAQQYRQGAPMGQPPGQQVRFPPGQVPQGAPGMQPRPGMPYPNQVGSGFPGAVPQMPPGSEQSFPNAPMGGKPGGPFLNQTSPAAAGPPSVGPSPSPASQPSQQDYASIKPGDELYTQKWRDLQKYKDRLNAYIAQTATRADNNNMAQKLRALQKIVNDPNQTIPYQTLIACENACKQFFATQASETGVGSPDTLSVRTPGQVAGLTPLVTAQAPESLIKNDRPSLKPLADSLSNVLTQLEEKEFVTLCHALASRAPSFLEDDLNLPTVAISPDLDIDHEALEKMYPDAFRTENAEDMSTEERRRHKVEQGKMLQAWMEEIPYALQMEIGTLLSEFDIVLDPDMHPDDEIKDDFIYLCCGLKASRNKSSAPPIGVAVPRKYPVVEIDFREMDVSAYDKGPKWRGLKKNLGEMLVNGGAERGCSLSKILRSWDRAVNLAAKQHGLVKLSI